MLKPARTAARSVRRSRPRAAAPKSAALYLDPAAGLAERVEDLLSRLTLDEKIGQISFTSPAIERLGIPKYVWWNECLHGVGRAGRATVFPQAIALAATFDTDLVEEVATAISDEARAKHHAAERANHRAMYTGLTAWSPNINIFRDPRWGRGQETYGEDPFLTARTGVAFIRGLQGRDKRYLKIAACAKHYAVHSGPESLRHGFDARVSDRDLWETYLPAFQAAVTEAGVESVMGAYNRTNGEPCCAHPYLIGDVLRSQWGFNGHFVSDCGAVEDFHNNHKVTSTPEESAARALKHGCDLCCGGVYSKLKLAVEKGLVTEQEIDSAVRRTLATRFRLGQFDPPNRVPYRRIPESVIDSPKHRGLSLKAARESIVLLKNENHLLPLRRDLAKIAVVGPNAYSLDALLGNYNGVNGRLTTVLEAITGKVSSHTVIAEMPAVPLVGPVNEAWGTLDFHCDGADVVIAVLGLSPRIEGEEGDATFSAAGGDRQSIELPECQEALLRHLCQKHKNVVLVLMSGSAVAVPFAAENVPAIVQAFYPGQEGGSAVADVLFGDYNPAGRLPVTMYPSTQSLPPFEDYSMAGRTYRYFTGKPLYPFGHGLSYTAFKYSSAKASTNRLRPGQALTVKVDVTNTGKVAGDEVVQLYLRHESSPLAEPNPKLVAFRRVHLKRGARKTVTLRVAPEAFAVIDAAGVRRTEPGYARIYIGGGQPAFASTASVRVRVG